MQDPEEVALNERLAWWVEREDGAAGERTEHGYDRDVSFGELQGAAGGLREPEQGEAAGDIAKMVRVVHEETGHENVDEGVTLSLEKSAATKK